MKPEDVLRLAASLNVSTEKLTHEQRKRLLDAKKELLDLVSRGKASPETLRAFA